MKPPKLLLLGLLMVALALPANAGIITCGPIAQGTYTHIGDTIVYDMLLGNPAPYPCRVEMTRIVFAPGTGAEDIITPAPGLPPLPISLPPVTNPASQIWFVWSHVATPGSDQVMWDALSGSYKLKVNALFEASGFTILPDREDPAYGVGQSALIVLKPDICVTKTVEPTVSKVGDEVVYTIQICNCGNADLTLTEIADTLLGGIPIPPGCAVLAGGQYVEVGPGQFELQLGECCTITIPYTIQPGDDTGEPGAVLENTVCVTAVDALGGPAGTVSACATAEVTLVHPSITITKTVTPPTSKAGDTVTYTITVTNTSPDIGLENIVVTDPLIGPGPLPGFPPTLAPGESAAVSFDRQIQPGDPDPLVNTATVHADPLGSLTNDITASASATVDLVHPSFTVAKDCPKTAEVGQTITYTVTVTNTSPDAMLVIVSAIDSLVGPVPGAELALLPPGIPVTFPYDRVVLPSDPNPLVNTVTVTVGLLDPPLPNQLTKSAECSTPLGQPGTEVTIVPSSTSVCEGESVTLTICERNTGQVKLTDVSVDVSTGDILEYPPLTDSGNGDAVLDPGEIWCWEVVVTVTTTTLYDAIGEGKTPSGVVITYPGYPSERAEVTINTQPCGGEGCTPGFWKNNGDKHGASAWCDRFDPSDPFSMHFSLIKPLVIRGNGRSTITNPTLLQALGANGGGVNAMIRHGVAAMLNACSDCVQYAYSSPDQVISMIEDTLNGVPGAYTVDELHSMFAAGNEAGCPVNQQGQCVGVEDGVIVIAQ